MYQSDIIELIRSRIKIIDIENTKPQELKKIREFELYQHEKDVLKALELVLTNNKVEFCNYEKSGEGKVSKETFEEYFNRIKKIENSSLILRIALFLHDIGKRKTGVHPKNSFEIAKRILPCDILSLGDRETILWLIHHHDVLGNIYTGERKPSFLLEEEMKGLALNEQEERLALLQVVMLCDLRGFEGGIYLTEKKATFYLGLSNPHNIRQKDNELFTWRIKRWTSNLEGEDNPDDEKDLLNKIKDNPNKELIEKAFGERITYIIYGFYLFIALDTEELVKLMEEIVAKASKGGILLSEGEIILEFTKAYREGQADSEMMLQGFKEEIQRGGLSKFIEVSGNRIVIDNKKLFPNAQGLATALGRIINNSNLKDLIENLKIVFEVISDIARERPEYTQTVVEAFQILSLKNSLLAIGCKNLVVLIFGIMRNVFENLTPDHYSALVKNSIGHGFFHSFEVLEKALEIAKEVERVEKVKVDYEVIIASAILHDISYVAAKENIKYTFISTPIGEAETHHIDSAHLAGEILERMSKEKIDMVQEVIRSHRGKDREYKVEMIEAKIISDADTLVGVTSTRTHIAIVNDLKDKMPFRNEEKGIKERIESLKGNSRMREGKDIFMLRLNNLLIDRSPDKYFTKYAQKLISNVNSISKIKSDFNEIVESRENLDKETKDKIYSEFEAIIENKEVLEQFMYLK